jgi:hypothetical protein
MADDRNRHLRQQIRGLILLAVLLALIALLRADKHALFPPGWWRFW